MIRLIPPQGSGGRSAVWCTDPGGYPVAQPLALPPVPTAPLEDSLAAGGTGTLRVLRAGRLIASRFSRLGATAARPPSPPSARTAWRGDARCSP